MAVVLGIISEGFYDAFLSKSMPLALIKIFDPDREVKIIEPRHYFLSGENGTPDRMIISPQRDGFFYRFDEKPTVDQYLFKKFLESLKK